MKVLAVILVSLFALARSEITDEEGVLVLTTDNFDEAIEKYQYILVEFYHDECEPCMQFAPAYTRVAEVLKDKGSNIVLAKIDAHKEHELSSRYRVQRLPDIKLFRQGHDDERPLNYKGNRDPMAMLAWILKKAGPPSLEVNSPETVEELLETHQHVAFGFFREPNSNAHKSYTRAAEEMIDSVYIHTHDEALFKYYKIQKNDALILLKSYDHGRDDFDEEFSVIQMKNFVDINKLHIPIRFTKSVANIVFDQTKIDIHVVLFTHFDAENFPEIESAFRSVAYMNKDKYLFIVVNLNEVEFVDVFRYFDVDFHKGTSMRYLDSSSEDMIRYKPENNDFSAIGMSNFLKGVEAGMLKLFLKSEDLPEDWDQQPVKIVTTENFELVTQDPTKDVLLKFYSHLCYNCHVLDPIWEDLAEHYKDNPDVMIAKTNAGLNEYPNFRANEYPLVFLFPKGGKDYVQFFSDLSDFNEYVNFLDHDGYPPTQTWVTDEILERRAAKKAEEEKAKAAGKDDSEKKDEL